MNVKVNHRCHLGQLGSQQPRISRIYLFYAAACLALRSDIAPNERATVYKINAKSGLNQSPHQVRFEVVFPDSLHRQEVQDLARSKPKKDITEDAAVALFVAYISHAGEIIETTQVGDSGDYYILDRENNLRAGLLEISGTVKGSLESLFKRKERQVLNNDSIPACYVGVVGFAAKCGRFERVR